MDDKAKKLVQKLLQDEGLYIGSIDGIFGSETLVGLISAETKYANIGNYRMGLKDVHRNATAYLQIKCKEHGLDPGPIDGYWGPRTEAATDDLYDMVYHGEIRFARPEVSISPFPVQYTEEFYDFFGSVDEAASRLVNVRLPFPVKIAWDTSSSITRFKAHEKVAENFEAIYVDTLSAYGLDAIQDLGLDLWGGCYNKRKVRGGTKWSTHSWGIAEDRDPLRNKLRWGKDKAEFAKPAYEAFWNIVEKHGGVSLGREANFDFMHFAFARLK